MDDPPPGHAAAPQRHDPANLAGPAVDEEFGDVAVGLHLAGGDRLGDIEPPAGIVGRARAVRLSSGHWAGPVRPARAAMQDPMQDRRWAGGTRSRATGTASPG